MSLAALTICKHCVYDGRLGPNCIRCVNGSKFKNKAELDKGDEWDTYCRNDVESTRKMILATTNPYRDERITKDVLDSFTYCYKIDKEFDCGLAKIVEEVKEKENMNIWTNSGNIKLTVNDRVCKVDSWEIEESCAPYNMPRIRLEATMTRSAIPYNEYSKNKKAEPKMPTIKKVHFNPPVTVVLWDDNTKTIVRCENEEFDAEKGLAMAITKKVLGNKGNYFETVKKWVKPYEKEHPKPEKIKINAGLKPATFEFNLADVDIRQLGHLVGTTPDGMKVYFGNHEKLDGEA